MWYRVFGSSEAEPAPAAVLEHLHALEPGIRGHFRGDDQGWFALELHRPDGDRATLERFLSTEEDIRNELNTWAAWVESTATDVDRLMRQIIATQQVFTLQVDEADDLWVELCLHLARLTAGVYQVDGRGFFDAEQRLLIREEP